jgi:LSD1 subclass zinc finger protein
MVIFNSYVVATRVFLTARPGARTRCALCQALQAAFGATWGYSCLAAWGEAAGPLGWVGW